MKCAAILLATLAVQVYAADDAREIVHRALEAGQKNQEIERDYTYVFRSISRILRKDGSVKHIEIRTFDETLSEGTPYDRLIEIDDKPLSPDKERKEQERLRKSIEERRRESPEARAKRIAAWDKKREKERAFQKEMLEAMDFRMAGEEPVAGRPAWIVEAVPHPGYRPKSSDARFLTKCRGKMWIDQATYGPVRIEAEAIADISFGGFLAKVHQGSRFVVEETRVNDEVWLPRRVSGRITARVLTAQMGAEFELAYRDYRKFQTESRVLSTDTEGK